MLLVGSESTRVEARSASYLLQVKSKLGSGQAPSLSSASGASASDRRQRIASVRRICEDLLNQEQNQYLTDH